MFRHVFSYYAILSFFVLGVMSLLLYPAFAQSGETYISYAPGDHIREDQIHVYDDRVVLDVEDTIWTKFEGTGSMEPFFDTGAHALQYRPKTVDDISAGDIVSYFRPGEMRPVIHRVVYVGEDAEGVYFITKGDNNVASDPGKVRFEQIYSVVFAIIY